MKARVLVLAAPLLLGGCGGALPMVLSAAGGLMTVLKDGMDIDVAWHQMTPGKTPIATALTGQLVMPAPPAPQAVPQTWPAPGYDPYALAHQPIRTMEPVWSPGDPRSRPR